MYLDVLAAVTAKVDYLTVTVVPLAQADATGTRAAPDDDWVGCADLIADGIADLIDGSGLLDGLLAGTRFGTDDPAVRASLFFQGYVFRVASVVLGPYALGLPAPSVVPSNLVVRCGAYGVGAVGVRSTGLRTFDASSTATELLDHLAMMIEALRARTTISERLLWGDAASACARVLRAVEGADVPDRAAVRARGGDFMEAATRFEGMGAFTDAGSGSDWVWWRTTCCLWFRCTGGGYCDDCNMIDHAPPPTT